MNLLIILCVVFVISTSNVSALSDTIVVRWIRDRPLEETYGPKYAVYCRLRNPEGVIVYDGFGSCRVNISRVTDEHKGMWWMNVELPNKVHTQTQRIIVSIFSDPKPEVQVLVEEERPNVFLSCHVSSPQPVHTCIFRDPSGRLRVATEDIENGKYSFKVSSNSSNDGDRHSNYCFLQITDPKETDFGFWRCSIETEDVNYYGFLRVVSSWILRDSEVASAIILEPQLTADVRMASQVVGRSIVLSCSIQSAIRYCYFRDSNSNVYNVGPADPHGQATYVGAGFDAGECGIRFPNLTISDSRLRSLWSCNVGLPNEEERHARIIVTAIEEMEVNQRMESNFLVVEGQVFFQVNLPLEYCRFVPAYFDGFINVNIPDYFENRYKDESQLSQGRCRLLIYNPNDMELSSWTIVARILGEDVEISGVTLSNYRPEVIGFYRLPIELIIISAVGLVMILVAILLGLKYKRQVYKRASAIRNSFIKKKVVQENKPETNTATAA